MLKKYKDRVMLRLACSRCFGDSICYESDEVDHDEITDFLDENYQWVCQECSHTCSLCGKKDKKDCFLRDYNILCWKCYITERIAYFSSIIKGECATINLEQEKIDECDIAEFDYNNLCVVQSYVEARRRSIKQRQLIIDRSKEEIKKLRNEDKAL